MEDRRESPRVPMRFLLRDSGVAGTYQEGEGDLSIGGIAWKGRFPPLGSSVEVRFRLTGVPREIRARGEIIRVGNRGKKYDYHVRFTELDVNSELAIARYLDEHAR